MKKQELRIKDELVLCENCDTPASWKFSVNCGWVGCAPCMTGEASSFDTDDLITKEAIDDFLKELNQENL